MSGTRSSDALNRPLGAYFRVNHRDLVAMHAAINEVGILFATATVHAGWQSPKGGVIPYTISFYLMSAYFVFPARRAPATPASDVTTKTLNE